VKAVRAWFHRSFGLFRKRSSDAEFAAELQSHLQLHIEDNLRAGMTPEAARRDALPTARLLWSSCGSHGCGA